MHVIGVTGGIGTGKSTMCNFLRERGAFVFDLDHIGHESYKKGTVCFEELVAAFGEAILSENGEIDRKKLGAIVFSNEVAMRRLNAVVWPHMKTILEEKLREAAQRGIQIAVIEAALLFETGWDSIVDEVWVMVAPLEKIFGRLRKRNGWDDEEIAKRMAAQYSRDMLVSRADVVLDTDCSLSELADKVSILWSTRAVSL